MSWELKTMFIKHPSQPVLFSFSSASSLMQVPETRSNIKQLHTVTTTTSWKHSLDHVHPVPASLPVLLVQTALSPGISFLALCELFFLYLDLFACLMCNSINTTFTFPSGSSDGSLTYKFVDFFVFQENKICQIQWVRWVTWILSMASTTKDSGWASNKVSRFSLAHSNKV